jgi:hypothetical protein
MGQFVSYKVLDMAPEQKKLYMIGSSPAVHPLLNGCHAARFRVATVAGARANRTERIISNLLPELEILQIFLT